MDLWVYILIGVIVVILIYVLATYNSFVKLKNRVKDAHKSLFRVSNYLSNVDEYRLECEGKEIKGKCKNSILIN